MTRALVTGATGFIGGRLVSRLLAEGWEVHCLVRPSSDLRDLPAAVAVHRVGQDLHQIADVLDATRPDLVYHLASLYLAAHAREQASALVDANVTFPVLLAEAMEHTGIRRMVNTGTAWQHFDTGAAGAAGYNPVNLYAATKQAAQDLLRYYHNAHSFSIVTLELFDTYGRGDPRRKLVQLLVDAALSGESLAMSPGEQLIDLTHVDDVADAFLIAGLRVLEAAAPIDERYLLAGERLKVHELVNLVASTLGQPLDVRLGARPYRAREVMEPVAPRASDRLPGWQRIRELRSELSEMARER